MHYRKRLNRWLVIGLSGILLLVPIPILIGLSLSRRKKLNDNDKDGSRNRSIIADSRYKNYADWIIAMAKHESANFTSNVYQKNNNPFGMHLPNKRQTLASQGTPASDGGYWARYADDGEAIKDLFLWFDYGNFPTDLKTVDQYVSELRKRGYFTDSEQNYLKGLKRYL